ncbi:MAG: calcium-binding protein, partial [Pseudomonadota bacterium]
MPSTPETWLDEFRANTIDSGPRGNDQFESRIIQLDNGNTVVFYTDQSDAPPATPNDYDIVGQIFDPLGNRIGGEFVANNFQIDSEQYFDAVALPGGRFVITYEDNASGNVTIRATEWDTDENGVTVATARTIATPASGDTVANPTIAAFDDGRYVVAYGHYEAAADDHDVRFKIVSAAGAVGAEKISISGSPTVAGFGPDVAVLENGNIAFVTEYGTPDSSIVYRVHNGLGTAIRGAEVMANTSTNGDQDFDPSLVALKGGGFVVSWTNVDANDTDVEFQRFDNGGNAQGAMRTVNSGGVTDDNNESHLIALADGGFVVAYDDDEAGNIAFQRYGADGNFIGDAVRVSSSNNIHYDPSGVGLADGRFIIGWTENASNNADIKVKYFDPRDTPNDEVYTPDGWVVGTAGDDVFRPDFDAEIVHGWDGNDIITEAGPIRQYYGGKGDDTLIVTSAINSDLHDGGEGVDTIDWSRSSMTVINAIFDLAAETASAAGSVEQMLSFEHLTGTNNNDTILGESGGNILHGNEGNDSIDGRAGNDTITGGDGNDTLIGGEGTDSIDAGAGNDVVTIFEGHQIDNIRGGAGIDRLDLSAIFGAGVVVDTDAGTYTGFGGTRNIAEFEEIIGTQAGDFIRLDLDGNTIDGAGGHDTLQGGFGTDTVLGGTGDDIIQVLDGEFFDAVDGGAGNDTLDHSDVTRSGDIFDFEAGIITSPFDVGTPTLSGIETYWDGSGGNTIISSGAGSYFGNAGDDLMVANIGALERLDGGEGNDTVDVTRSTAGQRLNLSTGVTGNPGEAFTNFENARSGVGDDTLTGRNGANRLEAGAGDDELVGGAGHDTLDGGDGRDTMEGGVGNDQYYVSERREQVVEGNGEGYDTVIAAIKYRLGDHLESLILNGAPADDLAGTGNSLANDIVGDAGDNLLRGKGGDDRIYGVNGDDRITGGSGADQLSGNEGDDTLRGDGGADTL